MEDAASIEKPLLGKERSSFDEEVIKSSRRGELRKWRCLRNSRLLPALLVSIVLNVVLVLTFARFLNLDQLALHHTSRYWTPIMDNVPIKYKNVLFDSTLFGNSVYREDASTQVDQAWVDLGIEATHILPEEDYERAGFTFGMAKQRESDGGGFIYQLEVFHQLHCLDALRQGLYFNYDYFHTSRKGIWNRSDELVRKHMGHCLDLLRMQLQCSSDIGPVGMMWVNTTQGPVAFADFERDHKCRDFESIRTWALENDQKMVLKIRPGDKVADHFP